ncbi:MAG TPA: 3-hydroxyacyl-CoA dehydrogenase family protein [Geminicoccus sp.]|jgi:3-hydroxyacyl-CoA dehydrogenase|uniref:3-hydroxyacyl-CoA dehydrogenase family protein n=1 Tax=Geminicoccus sp. TaxID=2024832 RepID=UPI002E32D021|nr:3-hydroxyacyl-CoA dehydrogenase family protein [Geminicoccus sp.]HEX2529640.1 3-hydroxyacyl-CoA dehydrogenase family protein [Geminicoccus sp.]
MTITRIGIVGAGTMGGGIATATAQAGVEVLLTDAKPGAAAAAVDLAGTFFARSVEKGRLSQDEADAARQRMHVVGSIDALADVDLVIEAVFEDMALKTDVLAKIASAVRPDTLIGTNTSCLRVSELAKAVTQPERFLGLHYFSPAQVNPIVEVVRGEQTADAAVALALEFTQRTGKQPLACKDQWGFCINRFFCPYTNEAARLVDEGLGTPGEIDLVAKEAVGAAAGPFQVMNIVKPRINLHAIRNLAPLGAFYTPARSMAVTGDAETSWTIDPAGDIDPAKADLIRDRLRAGTFLPVLQELDEGVAGPAEIDHGAREALKFGKPPCALMDRLGRAEVERLIVPLCSKYGYQLPKSLDRVGSLIST